MPAQQVKLQPKTQTNRTDGVAPMLPGVARKVPPKPAEVLAARAQLEEAALMSKFDGTEQAEDTAANEPSEPLPDVAEIFAGGGSVVAPETAAGEPSKKGGRQRKNNAKAKADVPPVVPAPPVPPTAPLQVIPSDSKPPSTVAEYIKQQTEDPPEFPDVASLFGGMTEAKPVDGVLSPIQQLVKPVNVAPVVAPVQTTVTVAYEKFDKEQAYKFTRSASIFIGGMMQNFDKGQVIYDFNTIQAVLAGGFDGLEPFEMASSFIQCPSCHHQFPGAVAQ